MTTTAGTGRLQHSAEDAWLARHVVDTLGGRYSTGLGIDVDAGDAEIERWFLAATLFGTRTSAAVAERTFRVLSDAGLARIGRTELAVMRLSVLLAPFRMDRQRSALHADLDVLLRVQARQLRAHDVVTVADIVLDPGSCGLR